MTRKSWHSEVLSPIKGKFPIKEKDRCMVTACVNHSQYETWGIVGDFCTWFRVCSGHIDKLQTVKT